jgi:hypothetical protein
MTCQCVYALRQRGKEEPINFSLSLSLALTDYAYWPVTIQNYF